MIMNPEDDGVTHINVYSKGKTELGRFLSNFAYSPFEHPTFGRFTSVEGFWYWLKTGQKHDMLRDMFGTEAKTEGKKLQEVYVENFDQKIETAIRAKLIAHPLMLRNLISSELPLMHYYVYYGNPVDAGYEWITRYIAGVRESCRARGYCPSMWEGITMAIRRHY